MFKKKTEFVEAFQVRRDQKFPEWFDRFMGWKMQVIWMAVVNSVKIETNNGILDISEGSWIVWNRSENHFRILSDGEFKTAYELCGELTPVEERLLRKVHDAAVASSKVGVRVDGIDLFDTLRTASDALEREIRFNKTVHAMVSGLSKERDEAIVRAEKAEAALKTMPVKESWGADYGADPVKESAAFLTMTFKFDNTIDFAYQVKQWAKNLLRMATTADSMSGVEHEDEDEDDYEDLDN